MRQMMTVEVYLKLDERPHAPSQFCTVRRAVHVEGYPRALICWRRVATATERHAWHVILTGGTGRVNTDRVSDTALEKIGHQNHLPLRCG